MKKPKGSRQIPYLHWQTRTDGTQVAHWKPSPRLRKLGWQNRMLGTGDQEEGVIMAALALNRQVAEWEASRGIVAVAGRPRQKTFGDLVAAYRESPEWMQLAAKTQREYNVRLRFLESWAMDGNLHLGQLDKQMVLDLRKILLTPDEGKMGSLHRAGAIMRVLRLLLNWAVVQGWLAANPADKVTIPTAPSRTNALISDQVDEAEAAALALGWESMALAMPIAFWSLQREADLLGLTRFMWRPIENAAPADAAVLANHRGDVMGFRLQQSKTKRWVTCPIPPFLHDRIEAAWRRSDTLLPDDLNITRACPDWLFQRRVREVYAKAGLDGFQFRDLRRSGMMMFSQMGAELPGITAISGHMVFGRKTILDTYMPANDRAACAATATVLRTLAARKLKDDANG